MAGQRQIKVSNIVWLTLKRKSKNTGLSMGRLIEWHILQEMPLNSVYGTQKRNKRKER